MKDYIYAHLFDAKTGKHVDHCRSLGKLYGVGDIIMRHVVEGYIPLIIRRVEDREYHDTKVKYQALFFEEGEYVKTHCDHDWKVSQNIQLAVGSPVFDRSCTKCRKKESFNYGKAKWE